MSENVHIIDVDAGEFTDGMVVPKDLSDGGDAHAIPSRSAKSDWLVKVVNDSDASVDVTPLVTTTDDASFTEYDEDAAATTVSTGSPPANVETVDSSTTAGFVGARLNAGTAPTTGTIKVVFDTGLYGGA